MRNLRRPFIFNETGSNTLHQEGLQSTSRTGYIWRERILKADFAKFKCSNMISSQDNTWDVRTLFFTLPAEGSLSVRLTLRKTGSAHAYTQVEYASDKDARIHEVNFNNVWDEIIVEGIACSQDVINILVS
ncbi:hypothetical protein [Ewingella americana]|uniref:Uncharacterized protein n=1 Tax=Ewingella americana TaxID=41202 RepID=A0A502GEZ6_9GAMM|nr:hypothetical protein [Ewingella americana]TPG60108.1 hypothetical protein EAH77_16195 [Ewingella americana]